MYINCGPNSIVNIKFSLYGEMNKYPFLLKILHIKLYTMNDKNNFNKLNALEELYIHDSRRVKKKSFTYYETINELIFDETLWIKKLWGLPPFLKIVINNY